ncbi:MAG: hypothetical protein AAFN77_18920 [Planctomycetota bacterium]
MTPMEKVDLLRAACCVAGIDGNTGDPEFAIINRLASEVGVGQASVQAMIERGVEDPTFHQEQFRVLKADPQQSMAVLLEVALADGKITDGETGVLRALSQKLNVPGNVFDQLLANVKGMGNQNG